MNCEVLAIGAGPAGLWAAKCAFPSVPVSVARHLFVPQRRPGCRVGGALGGEQPLEAIAQAVSRLPFDVPLS